METTNTFSSVLLWLLVINLGIAFGAGLYEHRVVIPQWLEITPSGAHWHAEKARLDDVGRRFWGFVSTMPLTLLMLANLFAAWRYSGPGRGWWIAAGLILLAERAFTFSYFIPTMVGLIGKPDSEGAVATAKQWLALNFLRHSLVLGAWLAALRTFSLFFQHRG